MKKIILFFCLYLPLFSLSVMEEREWAKNEFFLSFLEHNSLPLSLYWDLDPQDRELASEIKEGEKYQILWDNEKNEIEQILIPINGSDLQIHIYKDINDKFTLSFTPVAYEAEERVLSIEIERSAYQDVETISGSTPLARAMRNAFRGSIDFTAMQKGDKVSILYERKERLGQRFGDIVVKMVTVEVNKKPNSVFFFNDTYYDANGKELESFLLTQPVKYTRISSYFTRSRYHPVLRKYRAHLGVDFAAPTGTPVRSAGSGVVSFVGTKGGYGKTVQVNHGQGYSTLYAHLSRFAAIKRGQKVKQGQTIAYVGSTGVSTGPHLHFGLYLNNRAINPLSVVKISRSELKGDKKKEFENTIVLYQERLQEFIKNKNTVPKKESLPFENYVEL